MKQQQKKWLVVVAVLLGSFTMILNNSMLNPAVPQFMEVFDTNVVATGWIITIFMVTMGMTVPVTGYLGDRFGKKRIYLIGLAIFVCGSIIGAFAWNLSSLILFRGLQGIGGGIMMPLSMALIFEAFPKKERGLATGVWGIASMMAPTIGPTIGGILLETTSWHYLFITNAPFGLLGLWFAWKYLPQSNANKNVAFDLKGFVFVTIGVGSILFALGRMSEIANLLTFENIALLLIGVLSLIIFVKVESSAKQPLLDLSLFKIPVYTYSILLTTISSVGLFSGIFLIPLLIQQVYGLSAVMTGLVFLPSALFTGIFMTVGGRILDVKGARGVITSGLLITGVGTLAMGFMSLETTLFFIIFWMAIRGIGNGLSSMPSTTTGMNAIPDRLISRGSALNNVARQMSSAFSVVFISIFYEVRRGHIFPNVDSLQQASIQAINEAFIVVGILTLLLLPIAYLLEKKSKEENLEQVSN
ncbi:MDR family MFS transporter [Alkalihalobacillus trypoxylicola]|uniref:MFS transporter n=1 Tax=Alkalihalobacillus trypoxylicola TaxID=519424 RepID=A0A162EIT2_9BACI|nr:MDR family MFS transporter [Alkalihalobacillus trypoxylicola]KYG33009.1 MFS transporter [Alkalihalobacillus trypoxylicola]